MGDIVVGSSSTGGEDLLHCLPVGGQALASLADLSVGAVNGCRRSGE
jgi:hypothetical protein